MTDEDFLELIADEFKVCITKEEIPTYKKAILNCAKVLKDENKKNRKLIKKMLYEYLRLCVIKKETIAEAKQFLKE